MFLKRNKTRKNVIQDLRKSLYWSLKRLKCTLWYFSLPSRGAGLLEKLTTIRQTITLTWLDKFSALLMYVQVTSCIQGRSLKASYFIQKQVYLPAPHSAEGLRPKWIQSFFMRAIIRKAVIDTSFSCSPKSNWWANRWIYRLGSGNKILFLNSVWQDFRPREGV